MKSHRLSKGSLVIFSRSSIQGILLVSALICVSLGFGHLYAEARLEASQASPSQMPTSDRLPGVDLAEDISQITGVAISPLLGVSFVGAWSYYRTPETQRHLLPWFCHPYVWGFGFVILALCFLKDLVGTAAPPLIKKPFDIAELFENKLSALVASAAFVPFIASQMAQPFSTDQQTQAVVSSPVFFAADVPLQFATIVPSQFAAMSFDLSLLFIPLAVLAFLVVWLASHAINVAIALSPFGFIDAILKLFKMALLSLVILSYFINPFLGAAVSLIILLVAAFVAAWAFRLTVFGTLLACDTIAPARARRSACPTEPHAFLAHRTSGVPARTYGRFKRAADGSVRFTYRPWLLFRRELTLPAGNFALCKGVFFPCLLHNPGDAQLFRTLLIFLPRYRAQEHAIATHFEISDVREGGVIRGFKAVRTWFADTLSLGRAKHAEVQATRMG
jgi:hypothetical protein